MNALSLKQKNALLYIAVFLMAWVVFYPRYFWVPHDLSSYLEIAHNFVEGRGMVFLDNYDSTHRFGYKFLIALALKLGGDGHGLFALMLMQTGLVCLLMLSVFVFTRKYFDNKVAWLSLLVFFLTPSVTEILPGFAIDGVWPILVFPSVMLFLYQANAQPDKYVYSAVFGAGILAGLMIWLKEMAGFNFLLVPLLLVAFGCANYRLRRLVVFYTGALITVLVGFLLVHLFIAGTAGGDTLSEKSSMQTALYVALNHYHDNGVVSFIQFFFDGIKAYFIGSSFHSGYIAFFPLTVVFVLSLPYMLFQAIGKEHLGHKIVTSLLLTYSLYMAWAAQWDMRPYQIFLICCVINIVAVAGMLGFIKALYEDSQRPEWLKKVCSIFIVGGLILTHYGASYTDRFLSRSDTIDQASISKIMKRKSDIFFTSEKTDLDHEGAKWADFITSHIPKDQKANILLPWIIQATGLSYALPKDQYKINISLYSKIMFGVHEDPYTPYYQQGDNIDLACMRADHRMRKKRYEEVLVFDHKVFDQWRYQEDRNLYLFFGRTNCMLYVRDWIHQHGASKGLRLVNVGSLDNDLHLALYRVDFFEPEQTINDQSVSQDPKITAYVRQYIADLKRTDRVAYNWYSERYPFLAQ